MAKEYIEREALVKKLKSLIPLSPYPQSEAVGGVIESIVAVNNQPAADVVEVVRCSECEHFTEGMAVGMCKRVADKPIIPIPYNHYCSFGVKRTEKQDD